MKALIDAFPGAEYLYFGDTARLPYGSKSVETVARYACEAARFLEQQGAQLLVIACNTATALALEHIRSAVSTQVLGVIEPGAQRARLESKTGKAVVIGTEATVASHAYDRALTAKGLDAREKACPLLVPLVEEGWVDHPVTEQVARIYLNQAFSDGFISADVLVLGCTHYPLLKPLLGRVVPKGVRLVDSAEAIAQSVLTVAAPQPDLHGRQSAEKGSTKFFVTDSIEKFERFGRLFLGRPISDIAHVDLKE